MRTLGHGEPWRVLRKVDRRHLKRDQRSQRRREQQRETFDSLTAYSVREAEHAIASEEGSEQQDNRRLILTRQQLGESRGLGAIVAPSKCREGQLAESLRPAIARE